LRAQTQRQVVLRQGPLQAALRVVSVLEQAKASPQCKSRQQL
jgi:hypothetical protein